VQKKLKKVTYQFSIFDKRKLFEMFLEIIKNFYLLVQLLFRKNPSSSFSRKKFKSHSQRKIVRRWARRRMLLFIRIRDEKFSQKFSKNFQNFSFFFKKFYAFQEQNSAVFFLFIPFQNAFDPQSTPEIEHESMQKKQKRRQKRRPVQTIIGICGTLE